MHQRLNSTADYVLPSKAHKCSYNSKYLAKRQTKEDTAR